jgi:endonuclease/exonuclease/phosphatase family metal-dependent hydrolase
MEPLDILTFNIRGEDVSHWAQDGFKREHKYERIAALVRSHSPHAVTLQEVCDDMAGLMQDEMEEWGFTQLCSAPSPHLVSSTSGTSSGGTFIYVESNLVDAVELPAVGPVALARICQPRLIDNSDVDVFLAACHLNHGGKEGAARRDQLAAALAALPEGCLVVVAGDTNLRGQYEDNLGVLPLQLLLAAHSMAGGQQAAIPSALATCNWGS